MAEVPAGRIGHSTEIFIYTGDDDYAETRTIFADRARTASGSDLPLFYPPGKGETTQTGGYRGYSNQPASFLKIGRIRDISGPEPQVNEVEVTSNDSPLNYKEFIPGLKDGGTVSFDMIYDVRDESQTGTSANSMETIFENQETRRFAIRVPVYRLQDRITDIQGDSFLLNNPSPAYGGASGYAERTNSINKFSNQAFILFSGFILRLGNEIPMEEAIMRSVELKVTGRVKSPNLAVATSFDILTGARYIAIRTASNTFAAGDFTGASGIGPTYTNLFTLPTMAQDSHIGIAIPSGAPDPTVIRLGGENTNRLGRFREQSGGNITIAGATYTVWQTRTAQDQSLTGNFIEIIQ